MQLPKTETQGEKEGFLDRGGKTSGLHNTEATSWVLNQIREEAGEKLILWRLDSAYDRQVTQNYNYTTGSVLKLPPVPLRRY